MLQVGQGIKPCTFCDGAWTRWPLHYPTLHFHGLFVRYDGLQWRTLKLSHSKTWAVAFHCTCYRCSFPEQRLSLVRKCLSIPMLEMGGINPHTSPPILLKSQQTGLALMPFTTVEACCFRLAPGLASTVLGTLCTTGFVARHTLFQSPSHTHKHKHGCI